MPKFLINTEQRHYSQQISEKWILGIIVIGHYCSINAQTRNSSEENSSLLVYIMSCMHSPTENLNVWSSIRVQLLHRHLGLTLAKVGTGFKARA